jgi:integrase
MARRRTTGEGTVYRRKDGRWEGAIYLITTTGTRKRIRFYTDSQTEASAKLAEAKVASYRGVPVPERMWKVGRYLDYWLENIVRTTQRQTTYERYEPHVRLYLKPALGKHTLKQLTVPLVQTFLNQQRAIGKSIRHLHACRAVLSAALTQAMREEQVSRNVARLVRLPSYAPEPVTPWTLKEARLFLAASSQEQLHPAFALLVLYGLRRGEVLGLRWSDVDFQQGEMRIVQQLQLLADGFHVGPVKTRAGRRALPLLNLARRVLEQQRSWQANAREGAGEAWMGAEGDDALVFTTRFGTPIAPRNFMRTFYRVCEQQEVRHIKLHHVRHTAATLLKGLGVPVRDAQLILGHSDVSVTQGIYQHDTAEARRDSLTQLEAALTAEKEDGNAQERCRQVLPSSSPLTPIARAAGDFTRWLTNGRSTGIISMVHPARFELATPGSGNQCSIP